MHPELISISYVGYQKACTEPGVGVKLLPTGNRTGGKNEPFSYAHDSWTSN
jgi:hypothetical protein